MTPAPAPHTTVLLTPAVSLRPCAPASLRAHDPLVCVPMHGVARNVLIRKAWPSAPWCGQALTTPVPTTGGNASTFPANCANADVALYNTAAAAIMDAAQIPTVDM